MSCKILIGDCRERMRDLPDASVDSVVTDPPYHLTSIVKRFGSPTAAPAKIGQTGAYARASKGFMGQTWDGGDVAFDPATWSEVLRVLKPGGHLVAFSGTRTYHRMACAIEDAGFEIRDQIGWAFGSGFPKSLNVQQAMNKADRGCPQGTADPLSPNHGKFKGGTNIGAGAAKYMAEMSEGRGDDEGPWQGWGTALKPSWEPICLARKPLDGTVAGNVLTHGTGALNIDGCRIEAAADYHELSVTEGAEDRVFGGGKGLRSEPSKFTPAQGRWPANLCHDGSDEVLAGFPDLGTTAGSYTRGVRAEGEWLHAKEAGTHQAGFGDSGSAARFFYCAKSTTEERGEGNNHPTVKPIALMRWLCRLVTPKGGTVLDPFMGSGSTGIAADAEQFNFIGCELSADYAEIARGRIAAQAGMFADIEVSRTGPATRAA